MKKMTTSSWALLALLCFLCAASLGRAAFMDASSMTTTNNPDLLRSRRDLSPLECYRDLFGKSLDQRILVLEIVEARLAIHQKLGLLDRFNYEVEFNDFLGRDCLLDYRKFLAKDRNLKGFQQCNSAFAANLTLSSQ